MSFFSSSALLLSGLGFGVGVEVVVIGLCDSDVRWDWVD